MRNKKKASSLDNTKRVAEWLNQDKEETLLPELNLGWPLHKVTVPMNTQEDCTNSDNESKSLDVKESESRPAWPLFCKASEAMNSPAGKFEAKSVSVVQWVMGLPNRSTLVNLQLADEIKFLMDKASPGFKLFSYAEILFATSQFSSDNLIGEGGCSSVYKGRLRGGNSVAVKILKAHKKALEDFLSEAKFVSSIKHKHIASLVGVCVEYNNLILVYELFPRGSLAENLHGCNDGSALPWEARFNVAVAVAEALNYLHNDSPQPIIHRDVKSSNILLSKEFQPQLSDFGLAIRRSTEVSYVISTDVVGTFGYMAPEYFMQGKLSDKVDVYAFGVVLLELLSGKKPVDFEAPKGQVSLIKWAKDLLDCGYLQALLDPKLKEDYDIFQMRRMSMAASLCTNESAALRPNMRQVLKILTGETNANECIVCHEINPKDLDTKDKHDHFLDAVSIMSHSFSDTSDTGGGDSISSSSSTDTASSAGRTRRLKLRQYLTIPDDHF